MERLARKLKNTSATPLLLNHHHSFQRRCIIQHSQRHYHPDSNTTKLHPSTVIHKHNRPPFLSEAFIATSCLEGCVVYSSDGKKCKSIFVNYRISVPAQNGGEAFPPGSDRDEVEVVVSWVRCFSVRGGLCRCGGWWGRTL